MKRILLILLLAPFLGFSQYTGSFVVGTSHPAPYNTLANAVAFLNTKTLTGPVTFLIDNNETVSSTITISNASITSANTFTIKPNTGKTIVISGNLGNSPTAGAIIKIDRSDYVTIDGSNAANGTTRNLTITNTSTVNYNNLAYNTSAMVWLASAVSNGSNFNTIKNVIFTGSNVDGTTATSAAIVLSGTTDMNTTEPASNSNATITNNYFSKVKQGVVVLGNSAITNKNLAVSSNTFGATGTTDVVVVNALRLSNVENATVSANNILGVVLTSNYTWTSAIYVSGKAIHSNISGNNISNIKNTGGGITRAIYLDMDASIDNNLTIENNFLSNITSSATGNMWDYNNSAHGIWINAGRKINIYFNTVNLSNNSGNLSSGLFLLAGSYLDIRNNIVVNTSNTAGLEYGFYVAATVSGTTFTSVDYNDFYGSDYFAYVNNNSFNNNSTYLGIWNAIFGGHSINTVPTFISSTDLHLSVAQSALVSGTAISGITTDIDSDTRSTPPTMGADEFSKCTETTVWNGSAWSNGAPTTTTSATLNADYSGDSFTACELVISAAKTLTIAAGKTITVENDITLNGSAQLIVADDGSLVQVSDTAVNTGAITVQRQTTPLKQYDYTYWAAPVASQALQVLTNGDQSVFYSFDTMVNNWTYLEYGVNMVAGKGYISRAPENLNFSNNNTPSYTVNFNGPQNSGEIKINVIKSGTYGDNLIGNPYPSALDAKKFIQANASKISGTIYFWTHKSAISASVPGSQSYNYTADDYAKYNLTGGVGTGTAPASAPSSTTLKPNGYIASGQAFFVEAINSGTAEIKFNNAMRTGGSNNAQFYRNANIFENLSGPTSEGRLWLNISNTDGAYSEMLLGYVDGATNTFDNLYDGKTMDAGNYVSLYSILDAQSLAIQGRGLPFSDADVIPLGFNTTISGSFSISMNDLDGFFTNQDVYLYDNTNNTITNLNEGPYTFNSETGTFNDRFELRFTNATLGTEIPVLDKNDIGVIRNGNQIQIKSKEQNIVSVMVYDLLGRLVFEKSNIENTDFTTNDLTVHNQVVVVKIKTGNNLEMVKKVIMN